MTLSRRPAWRDNPIALESLARQGGPHGTPRQLRSTMRATVVPLVVPAHVTRQSGAVAPLTLSRTKGIDLQILFFGLLLKYYLKKD